MGRAGALVALMLAAAPATQAAELFPVQPLSVERDKLNEAYQRALSYQPSQRALTARLAAFLAFAAQVCRGPDVQRERCLGRLYNNQAQAFDTPLRKAGAYRLAPSQEFGRSGGKAYVMNLVELQHADGHVDARTQAFNQAFKVRALALLSERGRQGMLNEITETVSAAGGGFVSASLRIDLIGYTRGQEQTASETGCLVSFPWLLAAHRPPVLADLFADPDQAFSAARADLMSRTGALRPLFVDGSPSMDAQLKDARRWTFSRQTAFVSFDTPDCFDAVEQGTPVQLHVLRPFLRQGGPVDLTALVDVKYDD